MGKVKLSKISSQSFEHEADRKALEALKKTVGFEALMRALARYGVDKALGVMTKSSNVRVGPKQVPKLWNLYAEVCDTLDMEPPGLYLANSPAMNAFTAGVEKPVIVVTSALADAFSDVELQAVMGHELGHFMAGHFLYRTMAVTITQLLQVLGHVTLGLGELVGLGLKSALLYWYRCAELSADRAGLLAVQDPRVAQLVMMKLSAGNAGRFSLELDLDAFMEQARESVIDDDRWTAIHRALIENDLTHPWPVIRAREIDSWISSGEYARILSGTYVRRANGSIADGPHPDAGTPGEKGDAAAAEAAITGALARAYGVHVAPRIPEQALHLSLGSYVEPLEQHERVLALYDDTFSGTGDRGVILTNLRICSSNRPKKGIRFSEIKRLEELPSGLLSRPGLVVEDLELKFHTRDVRDAFKSAIVAGMEVHRPRS